MADTNQNVPTTKFNLKDLIEKIEIEDGWVTTKVKGAEDNCKILRYDMKKLVKWSAILTSLSSGTVFTMDTTALMNVVLMFGIASFACIVTVLAHIDNWEALQKLDTDPLETLAAQITAFVPFVLALYVSLTLSRWWALRTAALGKVFDAFANISMIISCELYDKKWLELRTQVAKYGFASVQLLMQAARMKENLKTLTDGDMLTPIEVNAISQLTDLWQRPMILWAWIMRVCVSAMDHNKSPAPRTSAVMAECVQAREGMATINTYLDTQLPFAYVHLITLLVNVQNIVVSVKGGIIFATSCPGRNYFVMVQQIVTVSLVCFIYQALLQISYMILDPFGDDVLDFPIKAYGAYLAATVDAMMEAQPECPVVAEDGTLHRPRAKKPKPTTTPSGPPADTGGSGAGNTPETPW